MENASYLLSGYSTNGWRTPPVTNPGNMEAPFPLFPPLKFPLLFTGIIETLFHLYFIIIVMIMMMIIHSLALVPPKYHRNIDTYICIFFSIVAYEWNYAIHRYIIIIIFIISSHFRLWYINVSVLYSTSFKNNRFESLSLSPSLSYRIVSKSVVHRNHCRRSSSIASLGPQ